MTRERTLPSEDARIAADSGLTKRTSKRDYALDFDSLCPTTTRNVRVQSLGGDEVCRYEFLFERSELFFGVNALADRDARRGRTGRNTCDERVIGGIERGAG